MMLIYIVVVFLIVAVIAAVRSRGAVRTAGLFFYLLQALFAVWIVFNGGEKTDSQFFVFDKLGTLFFVLMSVVSWVAFYQSNRYLDSEKLREFKLYNISLILLCTSSAAVYFADHVAVTWIFLEATTLAAAGLVYHRRNVKSLEATWKYIFVSSTGIAIAYLGILLLGTVVQNGAMSYDSLKMVISEGNPLYMKIAFLFIFVGYSCKMEIFPLYTIGVDANFSAPTPASALLSTVLVNAGFVSFFRMYEIIRVSEVYQWMSGVLIVAGIISLLIGAVYLRRTNNYKRFLAYSTVENMGIVMIGLGVGGAGVFAAVFHVVAHTLIKSGMFFNLAQIGKQYGSYRINRIGNYMGVNSLGAMAMLLGSVSLLAFPPSALFVSEVMILTQIIADRMWVLLAIMVLLICYVMYSFSYRLMQLSYKPIDQKGLSARKVNRLVTLSGFLLIVASVLLGLLQPAFIVNLINSIIS